MRGKFKENEKLAKLQMKKREYRKDDEGRTIINMNVKNDDGFLSEFSASKTPVISSDVADFIESSTYATAPRDELTLRIYSDCIDDEEKLLYTGAVREYYLQRYIANEQEVKRNRLIVLLLGIAGILVLIGEILFDFLVGGAIWSEVIDIVAWVLIWESAYIGIIETRALRVKKMRYLSYLSMKIEYILPQMITTKQED